MKGLMTGQNTLEYSLDRLLRVLKNMWRMMRFE